MERLPDSTSEAVTDPSSRRRVLAAFAGRILKRLIPRSPGAPETEYGARLMARAQSNEEALNRASFAAQALRRPGEMSHAEEAQVIGTPAWRSHVEAADAPAAHARPAEADPSIIGAPGWQDHYANMHQPAQEAPDYVGQHRELGYFQQIQQDALRHVAPPVVGGRQH